MKSVPHRWFDGTDTGQGDWRVGVRSMVHHGWAVFDAGECDGLKFECFNDQEVELVRELMASRPEIPFTTSRSV